MWRSPQPARATCLPRTHRWKRASIDSLRSDMGRGPKTEAVCSLLEREVVPSFYHRQDGIPRAYLGRIRESMTRLTPAFSSNRIGGNAWSSNTFLAPRPTALERRTAADRPRTCLPGSGRSPCTARGALRRRCVYPDWMARSLIGEVHLGSIAPSDVRVEILADAPDGGPPFRATMALDGSVPGSKARIVIPAPCPEIARPLTTLRESYLCGMACRFRSR
jgi:hypothetical protein